MWNNLETVKLSGLFIGAESSHSPLLLYAKIWKPCAMAFIVQLWSLESWILDACLNVIVVVAWGFQLLCHYRMAMQCS